MKIVGVYYIRIIGYAHPRGRAPPLCRGSTARLSRPNPSGSLSRSCGQALCDTRAPRLAV